MVELFGLPNLFQTLADSQVTGVLTLADREGDIYDLFPHRFYRRVYVDRVMRDEVIGVTAWLDGYRTPRIRGRG